MGLDSDGSAFTRIPGAISGRAVWDDLFSAPADTPVHPLGDHLAVLTYGRGVSTADLASFIDCVADEASRRIKTTGHEQYGQKPLQKFETLTLDELIDEATAEIADFFAYGAMALIRLLALRNLA